MARVRRPWLWLGTGVGMRVTALGFLLLPACGSASHGPSAPARDFRAECQRIYRHMLVIANVSDTDPAEREIQRCAARPLSPAQVACMEAAQDNDDMTDCNPSQPGAAVVKWEEARETLGRIAQSARFVYEGKGRFPEGDSGLMPGPPRCQGGRSKHHPLDEQDWSGYLWHDLAFEMLRPYDYSYRYVSDGKSFTVTAEADLDCDGQLATFTVHGRGGADGKVVIDAIDAIGATSPGE